MTPEEKREQRRQYAARVRHFIDDYRATHPCVDCGEANPVCLEFDHRVPAEKLFNVAGMRGQTLVKVKAEIEKCDIRCCNCHRKRQPLGGKRG